MQKYLTENEVDPTEADYWETVTHQYLPSRSEYYAPGFLGMMDSRIRSRETLKHDFGDDDRE